MPRGRGTSEYSLADHLNEAERKLADTEHHLSQMVGLLEDGGSTWDERVKRLAHVVSLAQQELSAIVVQFQKNNPG